MLSNCLKKSGWNLSSPDSAHVFTSIWVACYGDQCGCLQSYCPPVYHIPYSKLTTYTVAFYLGGLHSLPLLLSFYQKTIDVTNSVKPIIIIRAKIFPKISTAVSLISVAFSSTFF